MKNLIVLAALLIFSGAAHAESVQGPCGYFIDCGTYTHSAEADGIKYENKVEIVATGVNAVQFKLTMKQNENERVFDLALAFAPQMNFLGTIEGQLYATGICRDEVCTFALVPMNNEAVGAYGIAGVIRFVNGGLEYNRFAAGSDKDGQPLQTQGTMQFTKQP